VLKRQLRASRGSVVAPDPHFRAPSASEARLSSDLERQQARSSNTCRVQLVGVTYTHSTTKQRSWRHLLAPCGICYCPYGDLCSVDGYTLSTCKHGWVTTEATKNEIARCDALPQRCVCVCVFVCVLRSFRICSALC
jgi:hypothetical protein